MSFTLLEKMLRKSEGIATYTPKENAGLLWGSEQANDIKETLDKPMEGFFYVQVINHHHHRGYRRGLFGGLLDAGMGGASWRSVGASSRVTVARRMALRSRLPRLGCVLVWP
jgi:hypothetical protein